MSKPTQFGPLIPSPGPSMRRIVPASFCWRGGLRWSVGQLARVKIITLREYREQAL
jgi:hypothetical protein